MVSKQLLFESNCCLRPVMKMYQDDPAVILPCGHITQGFLECGQSWTSLVIKKCIRRLYIICRWHPSLAAILLICVPPSAIPLARMCSNRLKCSMVSCSFSTSNAVMIMFFPKPRSETFRWHWQYCLPVLYCSADLIFNFGMSDLLLSLCCTQWTCKMF